MRLAFRLPLLVFGLLICSTIVCSQAARVETIKFQSNSLNRTVAYNVILPPDYFSSSTTRYPVFYLLHGLTGHYSDWLSRTNIADYSSLYRMIIVMPEGNDGWYTDSLGVPGDKYESYILKDLFADVQRHYRTIEARYGRGIAGLSMGGYGSFKMGLKSPASFAFAASMSGAFGITRYTEKEAGSSTTWSNIVKVFGPIGSEARKTNDVFELVRQLTPDSVASLPFFYFDCGTEDVARIFEANRELSALMLDKKVAHEFRELPGNHSWGYWDSQVQEVLKIASQKLRVPPKLPPNRRTKG